MESPECPVCLQVYDGDETVPRVLGCGHTTCEACLSLLPQRFPRTIRCPACTQLVDYPPQGPSGLPKNIDLLRFSGTQNQGNNPISNSVSKKTIKERREVVNDRQKLGPVLWSDEFYAYWKSWVLPEDVVLIESESKRDENGAGFYSVLHGSIVFSAADAASVSSYMLWRLEGNPKVSLVKAGCLPVLDDSGFSISYVARIMRCLNGMSEEERAELDLIMRVSVKQNRICKVYGFWGNKEDGLLYLVCQRQDGQLSEKLGDFACGLTEDGVPGRTMICMEICEAVMVLHSEGLIIGFSDLLCFDADEYGHVCIDLAQVFIRGRRISRAVTDTGYRGQRIDFHEVGELYANLLKSDAFISPELLVQLQCKNGIKLTCGHLEYHVGYKSDVWSLACTLLRVLIGKQVVDELADSIGFCGKSVEKKSSEYLGVYTGFINKVNSILSVKFGRGFNTLQQIICKCFNLDPGNRPLVIDIWKCIRELIFKPICDFTVQLNRADYSKDDKLICLLLGEQCKFATERTEMQTKDLQEIHDGANPANDNIEEAKEKKHLVQGLLEGNINCKVMHGHLDCITGLAAGGGFLFSSSFDKTVNIWSLQDFSHVHTFRGHEHKVMAVVYVDGDQPLCISGDSGGGIFCWEVRVPLNQEPLKKWYEQKDWRYSGIHSLTVGGNGYLYTGSGDKSVKAWLLQDGTLSCIMTGHKAVVSALMVFSGVLYSGSWDGTVRLWSLSDHSPLTVLEENQNAPRPMFSVLSLTAELNMLVASHENGYIKIWKDDAFVKSIQLHTGAIFATCMEGKLLFSGGWSKSVNIQEILADELQIEVRSIGSVFHGSVITASLYWDGKLFVGSADKAVKVYYSGK